MPSAAHAALAAVVERMRAQTILDADSAREIATSLEGARTGDSGGELAELLDECLRAAHAIAREPSSATARSSAVLARSVGVALELCDATRSNTDTRLAQARVKLAEAFPRQAASASVAWEPPADIGADMVATFLVEGRENLEGAERALLTLEGDPANADALNEVFRAFHTLKGTTAILGLTPICELAHEAESLLSRMRTREIACEGHFADLALRARDVLCEFLVAVERRLGGDALVVPERFAATIADLRSIDASKLEAPEPSEPAVAQKPTPSSASEPTSQESNQAAPEETARREQPQLPPEAQPLARRADASSEETVRVRTERLDRLIDMVGELVIAQAMVAQDDVVARPAHRDLAKKVARAGKIVRELQDLSLSLRMVPLKSTFQRMARLVRDVAQKSGKSVHFVAEGEETEIDRRMVDLLADPLVHMVRNAIDHGIEADDERARAGKPTTGTVMLRARHVGGNVVIELSDDGRGLDRAKIVAKALRMGLIDGDQALSDGEVYQLIFEPGFSTRDVVTDLSGRGVGMDVVRRNVEAVKGRIDISTSIGAGTSFVLSVPLTLAITDGMLVRVGDERFIVPTTSIRLSLRPDAGSIQTVSGTGELVRWRDEHLPLVRLHRVFGLQHGIEDATRGIVVVVNDGDRAIALLVDRILGQQQVVAKPLGTRMPRASGVSGAAILGDGSVGLILDPAGLTTLLRQPLERTRANS